MTTLVQALKTRSGGGDAHRQAVFVRGIAIALLALTAAAVPGGVDASMHAIADAYLQVTVFVAATLLVLYAVEAGLRTDIGQWLARHQAWQVPAGALLGALPGCGGAIVAVTQFTRGRLSFGGVVATLTSTMGDPMFLLLAREPATAGVVAVVGVVAGVVTGYVVDAIHGPRFMQADDAAPGASEADKAWFNGSATFGEKFWFALLLPGLVLGLLGAFQVETQGMLTAVIGVAGGLLALLMWMNRGGEHRDCRSGTCARRTQARRLVDDTNFVTAWVVFAFVGYELFIAASGVDLGAAFSVWGAMVPGMAIAVGLIPGCGPQIVTTSLYLDGAIPLSAQLGNSISNDGDALFPAIAKAPKAAALATLYTLVPAILVGYGAYAMGF